MGWRAAAVAREWFALSAAQPALHQIVWEISGAAGYQDKVLEKVSLQEE